MQRLLEAARIIRETTRPWVRRSKRFKTGPVEQINWDEKSPELFRTGKLRTHPFVEAIEYGPEMYGDSENMRKKLKDREKVYTVHFHSARWTVGAIQGRIAKHANAPRVAIPSLEALREKLRGEGYEIANWNHLPITGSTYAAREVPDARRLELTKTWSGLRGILSFTNITRQGKEVAQISGETAAPQTA
ncbi:MAG: hypothetical protein V1644_01980, partial [Candidatus Micrarchaeota archaeon]